MNEQNLTIKKLLEIIKQLTNNKLREYFVKIRQQNLPIIKNFQQKITLIKENANAKAKKLIAFNGKFALGGLISGNGFGDTIPILATPGEFVVRKAAVKNYGINIFTALNKATFDKERFPNLIKNYVESFAERNKSVYRTPIRFSGGGLIPTVEPKNNIVLDFKGGQKITLSGTKQMIEALITQLRHERLTTI